MLDKSIRYVVTWFYKGNEVIRYTVLLILLSVIYFTLWHMFCYFHTKYYDPLTSIFGGENIHRIIEYVFCLVLASATLSTDVVIGKWRRKRLFHEVNDAERDISLFEERIDQLSQALENREKALQASNSQRGAMLNSIPDLILQLDLNGTIKCWSGPAKDLYIPPSDVLSNNINQYMPIEIANLGMRYIRKAIETDKLQVFEYDLPIRGDIHTFEARMSKMDSKHVMMIARNITEIRKIEARNIKQFNMFKHMADNLPEMLWSKNIEGNYIFVNKIISDLMAENQTELLGKKIVNTAASKEITQRITETDLEVIRDQTPKRFMLHYVTAKGRELWLDVYKSPWWSTRVPMRVVGIVGSARDITNCMPAMSKKKLKEIGMIEISFDQCFHWSPKDPACNECMLDNENQG